MKTHRRSFYLSVLAIAAIIALGYYFDFFLSERTPRTETERGVGAQVNIIGLGDDSTEMGKGDDKEEHRSWENGKPITYYGKLRTFSRGETLTFNYYTGDKIWVNENWFRVRATSDQADFIEQNKDAVFIIKGIFREKGCQGSWVCYKYVDANDIQLFTYTPDEKAPKFEQYPATRPQYTGESATPNFKTNPDALMYRTMIREGVAKGPDFAGEFKIVGYGCGTNCVLYTTVNVRTGRIVSYNDIGTSCGIDYRMDSRLIIIHPPEAQLIEYGEGNTPYWCDTTRYYALSEDGTKLIQLPYEDGRVGGVVTLYGTVKQFSTSGSVKFYFDEKMGRGKLPNGELNWFWVAMDPESFEFKYILDHPGATFEMLGKRLEDDCGYIGDGTCIEQFEIHRIEMTK